MSAHVTIMRRHERHKDEQHKNYLKNSSSSRHVSTRAGDRQHRCHRPTRELKTVGKCWHSRDVIAGEKHSHPSSSIVTKRESTRHHEASSNVFHRPDTHVIDVCAVHTRPSTDSRAQLTNQIRTCIKSLSPRFSNVVLPCLHTVRTFPSY